MTTGPPIAIRNRAAGNPAKPSPMITTSELDGTDCVQAGTFAVATSPVRADLDDKAPLVVTVMTYLPLPQMDRESSRNS